MWRKFLGVGIPLLILGLVFYIIAIAQAASNVWGGGNGWAALSVIGLLLMVPGFMLVNAGLIGAAVGTERVTEAVERLRHVSPEVQQSVPRSSPGAANWRSAPAGSSPAPVASRPISAADDKGLKFTSVNGDGFLLVAEGRDRFVVGVQVSGLMVSRPYESRRLGLVELVEDGRSLARLGPGDDVDWAVTDLEGRVAGGEVTSLGVFLHVRESGDTRHTVWFQMGRTDRFSATYQEAWKTAILCFRAAAELFSPQIEPAVEGARPACPGCGNVFEPDTVYCGKCGTRVAG
jgi:ribosomal protein S27AE